MVGAVYPIHLGSTPWPGMALNSPCQGGIQCLFLFSSLFLKPYVESQILITHQVWQATLPWCNSWTWYLDQECCDATSLDQVSSFACFPKVQSSIHSWGRNLLPFLMQVGVVSQTPGTVAHSLVWSGHQQPSLLLEHIPLQPSSATRDV